MQHDVIVDIKEDDINKLEPGLLETLLFDRTTRKNILWGTDDYSSLGNEYTADSEIYPHLITGLNSKVIRPRILKALERKEGRTRDKAEVFTPSWVCNAQNNLVDEHWFGRKNVFNIPSGTTWESTTENIVFRQEVSKTWQCYVDAKRLEITCGEAPYLASRYDAVTGQPIPLNKRIGLLDRKLRVVNENVETEEDWRFWAKRAIESLYGYEFQGDSLLLARENILYSYIEYYRNRFQSEPDTKSLKGIALVISWNLWQMDGFNYAIPYCNTNIESDQLTLFELYPEDMGTCNFNKLADAKGQALCKIHDWRSKETFVYKDLIRNYTATEGGRT